MLRSPLYREILAFMDTGIKGSVNICESLDFSFPCMVSTNVLATQEQDRQKTNSFSGFQRNEQNAGHFEESECLHLCGERYIVCEGFSMSWKGMYFLILGRFGETVKQLLKKCS
jgi:hypothetical protein